jgi:putative transposase
MPWSETCAMDERMRFVIAASEDEAVMRAVCAEFGISRQTGYKWLARYAAEGVEGLKERSRAPLSHGQARDEAVVEAVLALRERHPTWGPKKLRKKLAERLPDIAPPARSTIGDWLRKEGLTERRRPRRCCPPSASPLAAADVPNAVWCADFKGWFTTGDRRRCDPLTISDAMSRYLLRCEAVAQPDGAHVRPVFEAAFCEFGLPLAIRSDNGPPFASTGAGGLSRLAVWWIKLGLKPERIKPGKPQQNGRHERMHRPKPPIRRRRRSASSRAASTLSAPSTMSSVRTRPWASRRPLRSIVPPTAPIRAPCASRAMPRAPPCAECARTAKSNGPATSSSSARR